MDKTWIKVGLLSGKTEDCQVIGRGHGMNGQSLRSTSDREAECCDKRVGLSVCPHAYLMEPRVNFAKCTLPAAEARFVAGGAAICYILPVLWMTSCFPIVGRTAA